MFGRSSTNGATTTASTLMGGASSSSSSVGWVQRRVDDPAAKLVDIHSDCPESTPSSAIRNCMVSSSLVSPVRVKSNTASSPSVTVSATAVTDRTGSSSSIVPVPVDSVWPSSRPPWSGLLSTRLKLSSGSARSSSSSGTEMVARVSPGPIVRVPCCSV